MGASRGGLLTAQGAAHDQDFREVIEFFIRACPGPPLAERGLRIVAYQRIPGIVGLEDGSSDIRGGVEVRGYIASVKNVAKRLNCSPQYLSQSALRRGYSYSRALRWLRFCHGTALRSSGLHTDRCSWRIGFGDPSGWTRFTQALLGKGPSQLPKLPLEFWVRRAVEDVYLACPTHELPPTDRHM